METYKIITDEEEFDKFVEFLPQLEEHEAYYIALQGRAKYLRGTPLEGLLKGDKSQLKRAVTTNKSLIKNKVRQMETVIGTYNVTDGGVAMPQEALALYITVNPRDLRLAGHRMVVDCNNALYNNTFLNPYTQSLKLIQNSKSKSRYLEYDFDVNKKEIPLDALIAELAEQSNLPYAVFKAVETRGGYHVFLDTVHLKTLRVNWNKKFLEVYHKYSTDTENKGTNLTPVPGSYQGGFTPRLFVF